MAIVAKTAEVLLGPPAYLVQIMLRVASRIVAGEWRGAVMGFGDEGERIPVRWDYEEEEGDLSGWSEDEVDFVTPCEGREAGRFGGSQLGMEESEDGEEEANVSWGVD